MARAKEKGRQRRPFLDFGGWELKADSRQLN